MLFLVLPGFLKSRVGSLLPELNTFGQQIEYELLGRGSGEWFSKGTRLSSPLPWLSGEIFQPFISTAVVEENVPSKEASLAVEAEQKGCVLGDFLKEKNVAFSSMGLAFLYSSEELPQ